ncbi:MAG: ABC transporter ATP-binding protein [Saprospiraceae bacterium]|nr:ABC transporter ATP-binding protein [Saprospiraceae bacterium]
MHTMLKVNNLSKSFDTATGPLEVLSGINFDIEAGKSFAIVGPSGSGKTTLLGLCAGLDSPSTGEVSLDGISLNGLSEDERALVRGKNVGFVFQNFQLIPSLTALENVMVPLELQGIRNAQPQARELLAKVGLQDREDHYPTQLSGGEQQRVCIARAFSNSPKILFADEPTGNLDEKTGAKVEELLFELNREQKTTLVLVTHDLKLAEKAEHKLVLEGGKIVELV